VGECFKIQRYGTTDDIGAFDQWDIICPTRLHFTALAYTL